MKTKVMYHSFTGNTRKVAEAISSAVGVSAEAITENTRLSEPIDLLFVGDGIYAGRMSAKTKAFIGSLTSEQVGNVAVFGTYGGEEKVIAEMTAILKAKGISVCGEHFSCKGKAFLFANRNHPSEADIDHAAQFAKKIAQSVQERS